ncbi:MAG: undecaprenyl-phosphate glucose phosphotransferase [Candidatus Omnitrophica bacterium]|nr:undecaprenyl-phosphate glucose phosphotransferase [Candidatus Omnitrophota bacterium]
MTPRRRKRDSFLPWVQLAVDAASIHLLLRACFWFRFSSQLFASQLSPLDYPVYFRSFHFILLVLICFFRFYGLYRSSKFYSFASEALKIVKAVAVTILVIMALTFFIRGFSFSRTFLVMIGAVLAAGVSLARYWLGLVIMVIDKKRGSFRNIVIIGCDETSRKLVHYFRRSPRISARVVSFLDDTLAQGSRFEGVSVEGRVQTLPNYLKSRREVHEVILAAQGLSQETVLRIIYECEKELVAFRWATDVFGLITAKMSMTYTGGVPVLSFTDSPLADWESRVLKRAMDMTLSLAALFILSPVFLILATLVKFSSPGPIFYGQRRIGEDGKQFVLLKFRTMGVNAEAATGPVWAKENDPRRTPLGAFLRSHNLDELPQLWNVFKGDMSLVGPRPERPVFVSQFKENIPRYMARHTIRSGITGWAQVHGLRGNTSIEERTKYDLYYIENWSFWLDVKILFMTFFARHNAY